MCVGFTLGIEWIDIETLRAARIGIVMHGVSAELRVERYIFGKETKRHSPSICILIADGIAVVQVRAEAVVVQ
jgi:hypothetical protein